MPPSPRLTPALSLLLLAACAGPPAAMQAPAIELAPAASVVAVPAPPLPPVNASLPAGAALVVAIDGRVLDELFTAYLARAAAEVLEPIAATLRVPVTSLGGQSLTRILGLDSTRLITAALRRPSAEQEAALGRLAALSVGPANEVPIAGIAGTLLDALASVPDLAVELRVIIPTTEAPRTVDGVEALLRAAGLTLERPLPGHDGLFAARDGSLLIGLSHTAAEVVVDLLAGPLGRGHAGSERARAQLTALRARGPDSPREAAPTLEGQAARAVALPAALGEIGALLRVAGVMKGAVEERDRAAAQGIRNAQAALLLSRSERGPYFDRYTVELTGFAGSLALTLRVDPGPALSFDPAAWRPSPSLVFPGGISVDAFQPWVRGWTLPTDPRDGRSYMRLEGDAGDLAAFLLLPHTVVHGAVELTANSFGGDDHIAPRELLRAGIFRADEHATPVHFGLLPPGASAASAACVLAPPPLPCAADKKLRPGATVHTEWGFARLVRVRDRWAVLISSEEAPLAKLQLDLGASVPPARMELPPARLLDEPWEIPLAHLLGSRLAGDVRLEGKQLVYRLHSVTAADP